jgi:hypothetical protein
MANCVHDLQQWQPEDPSLQEAYEDHVRRWEQLRLEIEALCVQLEEVPQRWHEYNMKSVFFDLLISSPYSSLHPDGKPSSAGWTAWKILCKDCKSKHAPPTNTSKL